MDNKVKQKLKTFLLNGQIQEALRFIDLVETTSSERTQSQHNSLFLWFTMIEKEAENAGITWNELVGHTHQLRITREGLHVMFKQLMKALWGTTSTKKLKKIGQIEILEQHFVDLFSKVGLELPPFPSKEKEATTMKNIEMAKKIDYPTEEYKEPLI